MCCLWGLQLKFRFYFKIISSLEHCLEWHFHQHYGVSLHRVIVHCLLSLKTCYVKKYCYGSFMMYLIMHRLYWSSPWKIKEWSFPPYWIFFLVVSSSTSSQSTTTTPPAGTSPVSTTSTTTPTTTPANNTAGRGGADAVPLSYYMFVLTILGAYFIQLLEH